MTLRGILGYRLVCAASFIAVGLILLIDAISSVQAADGPPFVPLLELGLAVVAFSLATRSLGSRVEMVGAEVRLHSTWRTIRLPVENVVGVVRGRFFGWDVLLLQRRAGRTVRLPLLTQPGNPKRLHDQEETLTSELHGRQGSSPSTTPP